MVLRARRARRQAGRWRGERAASEWRREAAEALSVPPSVLLLLSRPEAPSRLEHGKAPPQKHATPAEEEGAHLPRTWRLIVVPLLSLLVRSVAWVRRLPLLLSSRDCIPDLGELEYLTVQSKWSDEDQQSSSRAAAEQQHTTQTHFFVAPHQPRQPIAGVRVGVCLPSATEAAAHSLHRSERVPAIGWLTCVRLHLVQRGVASAAVTSLIHRPLPALALVRHTPSICCH